jgi:hypothetical protein
MRRYALALTVWLVSTFIIALTVPETLVDTIGPLLPKIWLFENKGLLSRFMAVICGMLAAGVLFLLLGALLHGIAALFRLQAFASLYFGKILLFPVIGPWGIGVWGKIPSMRRRAEQDDPSSPAQ